MMLELYHSAIDLVCPDKFPEGLTNRKIEESGIYIRLIVQPDNCAIQFSAKFLSAMLLYVVFFVIFPKRLTHSDGEFGMISLMLS